MYVWLTYKNQLKCLLATKNRAISAARNPGITGGVSPTSLCMLLCFI